jgi:hypothetical protein
MHQVSNTRINKRAEKQKAIDITVMHLTPLEHHTDARMELHHALVAGTKKFTSVSDIMNLR